MFSLRSEERFEDSHIMYILNRIVVPQRFMHRPQRFERIIHIRQRQPFPRKDRRKRILVREPIARYLGRRMDEIDDMVHHVERWCKDDETRVEEFVCPWGRGGDGDGLV